MHLSSKFVQRRLGRISPEPPSDTTALDTESVAGERNEVAGDQGGMWHVGLATLCLIPPQAPSSVSVTSLNTAAEPRLAVQGHP